MTYLDFWHVTNTKYCDLNGNVWAKIIKWNFFKICTIPVPLFLNVGRQNTEPRELLNNNIEIIGKNLNLGVLLSLFRCHHDKCYHVINILKVLHSNRDYYTL